MAKVDGEDLKQAEEVKYENLEGPSEAELSKARESTVPYEPPPMLVPVETRSPKSK